MTGTSRIPDRALFILGRQPEGQGIILHHNNPDLSYDRGMYVWVEQLGCSTQTMS